MKINNIHVYNTNFHINNNHPNSCTFSSIRGGQPYYYNIIYEKKYVYFLPEPKTKEEALKILSKYGITAKNINEPITDDGHTHLMLATHTDFAQLLIDAGADVNKKDKFGRTALIYAKIAPISYILLKNGADSTVVDIDGRHPLNSSTSDEQTELIIDNLRKKSKDTLRKFANLPDKLGRPPLMFAYTTTQAKMLLKAGADPNAKCNDECIINLIQDKNIKHLLINAGAGAKEVQSIYSLAQLL